MPSQCSITLSLELLLSLTLLDPSVPSFDAWNAWWSICKSPQISKCKFVSENWQQCLTNSDLQQLREQCSSLSRHFVHFLMSCCLRAQPLTSLWHSPAATLNSPWMKGSAAHGQVSWVSDPSSTLTLKCSSDAHPPTEWRGHPEQVLGGSATKTPFGTSIEMCLWLQILEMC